MQINKENRDVVDASPCSYVIFIHDAAVAKECSTFCQSQAIMRCREGTKSSIEHGTPPLARCALHAKSLASRVFVLCALFGLTACGASSARFGVGPILDSKGQVGIESTFSLGFGMPVDYRGRSQHYVQALGFIGGGADVKTGGKIFTTGIGADYIHWAPPRLDVRAGLFFVYRHRDEQPHERYLSGVGAHLAVLPIVIKSESSWIVPQLCIGPEVRIDQSWDSDAEIGRTHFVFPLVIEANLLAAGD